MSRPKGKKSNPIALWLVAGVAVVAAGALIAYGALSGGKTEEPKTTQPAVTFKTDAEQKANRNLMGDPKAKVQVVEWGDYL